MRALCASACNLYVFKGGAAAATFVWRYRVACRPQYLVGKQECALINHVYNAFNAVTMSAVRSLENSPKKSSP